MTEARKTDAPFDPRTSPHLARFLSGNLPPAHVNLGIRPDLWVKEADKGRILMRWPNDGSRDIASGRVFGGWVAALSDNVVSMCMGTALDEGEAFTTLDLQVKLFRPVMGEVIEIEAWVKNRSKTTGYVEGEWRLPDGRMAVKIISWKAIRPASDFAPRP